MITGVKGYIKLCNELGIPKRVTAEVGVEGILVMFKDGSNQKISYDVFAALMVNNAIKIDKYTPTFNNYKTSRRRFRRMAKAYEMTLTAK